MYKSLHVKCPLFLSYFNKNLNFGKKNLNAKFHKVIIKPIRTYGIELWGCSSKSNVNIIQRFQSKTLRLIAGAPRYVSNQTLHADLSITTVEERQKKRVDKHFQRLQEHKNQLANNLVDVRNPKRLKRIWSCDLRGE